ncbi:MAG: hypothetical protein LPK21_03815 [Hymenobacteraceae bacterium]|nr:hypothetical protein [Hymenobacteraceae bacterium]
MNARIRMKLIQLARTGRGTTTFQNLIHEAELGLNLNNNHEKNLIQDILDEISEDEHEQGRPLLSALVKIKGTQGQGDSFFKLAEELGIGEWRELKKDPEFVKKERKKVRKFWMDDFNFQSFV